MNAPNLSSLLNKSADDAKRPIPFNDGTYYGVIKSHQFGETTGQNKTPYVEYSVELTHAHADVDLTGYDEKGNEVTLDPNGKRMRSTFYLTDEALYRLKEFIESCGITTEGRTWNELIPQPTSQPVMVEVTKTPSRKQGEEDRFYNNIGKIVGMASVA